MSVMYVFVYGYNRDSFMSSVFDGTYAWKMSNKCACDFLIIWALQMTPRAMEIALKSSPNHVDNSI